MSNLNRTVLETGIIPLYYKPINLVETVRLELTTLCVQSRCSFQLSYAPIKWWREEGSNFQGLKTTRLQLATLPLTLYLSVKIKRSLYLDNPTIYELCANRVLVDDSSFSQTFVGVIFWHPSREI